jgi:hypothetical protein
MTAPEENDMTLGMAGPADLRAVRTGIGAALRVLYSDILREKLADRIGELVQQLDQRLERLDQQKDTGGT